MSDRNFMKMLEAQWAKGKSVCVGLDSELDKIPESARPKWWSWKHWIRYRFHTIVAFNRAIVKKTRGLVCAYKPNSAFYEAHGAEGIAALRRTIADIRRLAPDIPVILDAKRGDIGNSNTGYAQFAFDYLGADAITVHPFLGAEALQSFLKRVDKGVIVLCRTTNSGAGEFQDLPVDGEPLYRHIAQRVASEWNRNNNCALVVGATCPDEIRKVRKFVGDMPILIPGIGAQGGNLEETVLKGKDSRGRGMIINSSRDIIFASKGRDFAEVARHKTKKLHALIQQYRCASMY